MRQDAFQTQRARELRHEMTPTEQRLWSQLRSSRFAGYKFRRQTPVAGYFVDFYCARVRLIIELDGESHLGKEPADAHRQKALESHGYKVLRFWDTSIYAELNAVLELIWRQCEARSPTPHPQPLSPKGRGEQSNH